MTEYQWMIIMAAVRIVFRMATIFKVEELIGHGFAKERKEHVEDMRTLEEAIERMG